MMTEEQREEEILRLLNNTREEYHHCAFHSRGFGMDYFAGAEFLMRKSSLADLSRYVDVVEEVRRGHERCHFCHMKVLAYGEVMTFRRLPARYLFYKSEYERLYGSGDRSDGITVPRSGKPYTRVTSYHVVGPVTDAVD